MTTGIVRSLHVIGNLDVGGAQEVVRSLAPALVRQGCPTAVVALRDGPLRLELEQNDVPVRVIRGRRRSVVRDPRALVELWRIRREIRKAAEDLQADVIQTHLLRGLDFLMLTVRPRRRNVAWTFHNARLDLRPDQVPKRFGLLRIKQVAYRNLYHHLSRWAGALVAVSGEVGASIRLELRPARGRLVVISNGVDIARYPAPVDRETTRRALGVGPAEVLVTCVAKLHEQKGHRFLVRAFEAAAREDPSLRLALVGDGPLAEATAADIRERNLEARVRLLGARRDVPAILAASDVFVLPSLWEGLPIALLEAMASGLPVIATRVSGTEEVLSAEDAGILVEPARSEPLAEAITRLARDPALRERLGVAARRRVVDAFSVDAQARAHHALYRRLVSAAPADA